MLLHALTLLAALVPADTVRLDVAAVLDQAVARSLPLAAAAQREAGASHRVSQARTWWNPQLALAAENLGSRAPLGLSDGWVGVEGQATLAAPLPVGGDRGAAIREASALHAAASAQRALTEVEVRQRVIEVLAAHERDQRLAATAAEERANLEAFAAALTLGAEHGRFAAGDAARARVAVVLAATEEARRRGAAAASAAELGHLLALPAGTVVRIETNEPCARRAGPGVSGIRPERDLAVARQQAAAAGVALSRARSIPDLHPQVGFRQSAGYGGIYLGLGLDLPLFNRGRDDRAAARAEHLAAEADTRSVESRLEAERVAAEAALAALEDAGRLFTADWRAAVEQSVTAARANYELGEGTLTELLDSRRARIAALDDRERWHAEVRAARARAARLAGHPIQAELLCESSRTGAE